jgi:hypothetical protein
MDKPSHVFGVTNQFLQKDCLKGDSGNILVNDASGAWLGLLFKTSGAGQVSNRVQE